MQNFPGIWSKIASTNLIIFFRNFQQFSEEKNQNIHINDKFPLKIANTSLQKKNFPGMRLPNSTFFPYMFLFSTFTPWCKCYQFFYSFQKLVFCIDTFNTTPTLTNSLLSLCLDKAGIDFALKLKRWIVKTETYSRWHLVGSDVIGHILFFSQWIQTVSKCSIFLCYKQSTYVTWSRGMSQMSGMMFLRYWQKQCSHSFVSYCFKHCQILHNSVTRYPIIIGFASKWSMFKFWESGVRN